MYSSGIIFFSQVAEGEKQCKYLIQEMEKVRTELLKYKGKAEKAQMKKKVTDKVATSASSPVTPPPPGWESKVADLERENEDLRNENHRLIVENDVSQSHMRCILAFNYTFCCRNILKRCRIFRKCAIP